MKPEPDFVQWALAPELTIEEAFCAEVLVDYGLADWKSKNKVEDPLRYDWEAKREFHRKRRLNPAHRAMLNEIDVMRAAETLPLLTEIRHWTNGEDRALRDL